jgi:hypothetical protein
LTHFQAIRRDPDAARVAGSPDIRGNQTAIRDDSIGCDPDVNTDSGTMDITLRIRCYRRVIQHQPATPQHHGATTDTADIKSGINEINLA